MKANPKPLAESLADAVSLPLLPPGVLHLLSALRADDLGVNELTVAVRNFPPIAARVVALANSAWAAPREPVTHLFGACSLLGVNVVRSVCIALAIARPFDAGRCPGFDAKRFWCSALLTAQGAVLLRPYLAEGIEPNTLGTAGMLHNLGLLWMAHAWPEQTSAAFAAVGEGGDLLTAMHTAIGTDYCEMGDALGRAWKLPDEMTNAMGHHRNAEYRGTNAAIVAAVGAAAWLVGLLQQGAQGVPDIGDPRIAGLAPDEARAVFEQLSTKLPPIAELAGTLFGK